MGLIAWIKNIFGFFGRIFGGGEDRFSKARDEIGHFRRAEKDALGKLRLDRDEWKTTTSLKKFFSKLPNQFEGESRRNVLAEVSKFKPVLGRLEKESIRVEERELQGIIYEWETFKRYMQTRTDVKDMVKLGVIIRMIDYRFDRLTRDIASEAKLDVDETRDLTKAKKDIAKEEGLPEGSSLGTEEAAAKAEEKGAEREEVEVESKA